MGLRIYDTVGLVPESRAQVLGREAQEIFSLRGRQPGAERGGKVVK